MPPKAKDNIIIQPQTFTVRAIHDIGNRVSQDEYLKLSFDHAIEVADALCSAYRDVSIIEDITGEAIYHNYFSIELWETLHE